MKSNREIVLCRYQYDALNRLVTSTPSTQVNAQRFYLKDRLTTEIQGAVQRSIMQHEDQLLAQQQRQSGTMDTRLLATDQQRSVLKVLDATQLHHRAYTAYGHRPQESGLLSLIGFNGEQPDPVTGCYLLGNGYRAFNPVLMRFNSPDSWSPFGKGGLNAYAYCVGDPINRHDPNGHWSFFGALRWILRSTRSLLGRSNTPRQSTTPVIQSSLSPATSIARRTEQAAQHTANPPSPLLNTRSANRSLQPGASNPESAGSLSRAEIDFPHITPDEWDDLRTVFRHAPNDATTSDMLMVLNELRKIRNGQETTEGTIGFISQFVGN